MHTRRMYVLTHRNGDVQSEFRVGRGWMSTVTGVVTGGRTRARFLSIGGETYRACIWHLCARPRVCVSMAADRQIDAAQPTVAYIRG